MESFEYNVLCCHVSISVAILCVVEMVVIVSTYLSGIQHPLMTCKSYNVTLLEQFNQPPIMSEHRICTTNGPLQFWIIIHLFTNLLALISLYTKNTKTALPYLFATAMDLLMSSAYVVVLLVFVVVNEPVDKILLMTMVGILVFKSYDMLCGRRLYWYLQWHRDDLLTPKSTIVKNAESFQF